MYKINKTHNHKYISFNAVLDYINIQILRTLRQMINIINTLVSQARLRFGSLVILNT